MTDTLPHFTESFHRIYATPAQADAFIDTFYRSFTQAHPQVAKNFESVDMDSQRQMMRESLAIAVGYCTKGHGVGELAGIRSVHGVQGLNVPGYLYEVWIDSLMEAVLKHDSEADDHTVKAWQDALAPLMLFMREASGDQWMVPPEMCT